jgi:hypothetical protein
MPEFDSTSYLRRACHTLSILSLRHFPFHKIFNKLAYHARCLHHALTQISCGYSEAIWVRGVLRVPPDLEFSLSQSRDYWIISKTTLAVEEPPRPPGRSGDTELPPSCP